MTRTALLLLSLILLVSRLALTSAAAQGPGPKLLLAFPPEAAVGDSVTVNAYLLDSAHNPIQGEQVTFFMDAAFMNTEGQPQIGQAVSDEAGLAFLVYKPTVEGERTITVEFAGNEAFDPVSASAPLLVKAGPATYREEMPFRVPGANIYTVLAVLAGIWGIYLFAGGLLWLISRAGKTGGSSAKEGA